MATNNIRNKLFDNAVDLADEDGYIDEVDLTVQPWNRTTVADGQWLNDHAIKPLSSRDLFLADCIDAANLQIETISANLASIGVGGDGSGSSGTNGIVAGKLGRSNATFSDNSDNMSEKSVARVPGGLADTIQPAYSLQYFGFGPKAYGANGLPMDSAITQNKNAIIQANMNTGIASQIALTPSGMYYRGIEDLSPNNYVVRNPKAFLQVMMSPVLTTDLSGVITYSTDTNTFNIAALPDATIAVTGVTGNHLVLSNHCVKLNDTDLAAGTNYFLTKDGFSAYSVPDIPSIPTGVSGIAALSGNDGKISAYGLALGNSLQNGDFVFVKADTSITAKNITLPPFTGVNDVFTITDNELGLQTGNGIDITSNKLVAKCQDVISADTNGIKLNYANNYLTANGNNLDVAIDSVASYVLNTYTATYGESQTASSIKQVLEDLIEKVNSLIPPEPEEPADEG